MAVILGIDVGGSTTKIVGIENGKLKSPLFITATDPVTSLFGAFGKYLYNNQFNLEDIEQIILTGVGSAYINTPLYGRPTAKTDEFIANALGAKYQSGLDRLIAVSMGTGTSFIQIEGDAIKHLGGTGIGGGTLQGLSRLMLKSHDIHQVVELAKDGDIANINLQIKDICNQPLPNLPLEATASNFGKAESNAPEKDIATGIVYLVLQAIGSAAHLAGLNSGIKDYALIGNLSTLPQCREIFNGMEALYGIRFYIPPYSEYRTALGAALSYINRQKGLIPL